MQLEWFLFANTDLPMNIPKKPKIREPKRNKEFQNNKAQKDVIELLDVAPTDLRWCYEVCKGQSNFQRAVVDLEKEERAQLFKKFKNAKQHFECAKCGVHSTELAKKSQFIYCDLCDSLTHGSCSGLDTNDDKKVKETKFICVVCSGDC